MSVIINNRKIQLCLSSSALFKAEHISTAFYSLLERLVGPDENAQLEGSSDRLQNPSGLDTLEMKSETSPPQQPTSYS